MAKDTVALVGGVEVSENLPCKFKGSCPSPSSLFQLLLCGLAALGL